MKISARLKATSLVARIRKFPQLIKKEGEQILRTEGRSFAKELARQTLPIGLNDSAWKKLAFKIASDVRRALYSPRRLYELLETTVSQSLAKEVWALMHSGDKKRNRTLSGLLATIAAIRMPVSSRVKAELVKRLRTGEFGNVPLGTQGNQVVTSDAAVTAFIKKAQRNIGMAKAGWAAAGRSISGRNVTGIPQWASYGRHKVEGKGVYLRGKNRIRLTNEVRHSRKALPKSLEAVARRQAARNLHLHLLHAMNALMKAQFKKGAKAAA